MNCLIVDDELIARRGIEKYVQQTPFLNLAGSVRTCAEAANLLSQDIDLLILDIQMPQQTGLEFLKNLPDPPLSIIITAYPEYALQGFELDVIDYIIKPLSYERFLKACTKAKDYLELKQKRNQHVPDYVFLKSNGKIEKVFFADILYIEAKENYSHVFTLNGNFFILLGLGQMEAKLDVQQFMRVHKSFIVAVDKIVRIEGNSVYIGERKMPLSRKVKMELKARLLKA